MIHTLERYFDYRYPDSFAASLRKKRFAFFESLISSTPGPLKILDVGGTQWFWEQSDFASALGRSIEITILNILEIPATKRHIKTIIGDAKNMNQFVDNEFDIVFSNSVIEHVGNYEDQLQMAKEIKRVGKRYFVQTPNFYFPIEPHFLIPFFQFFPLSIQVWLITHIELGLYHGGKISSEETAVEMVKSIKLLSKKEVISIFPNANIFEEKVLGITKSFIAYAGWNSLS